jgi:CRP-like cAMP-binding protein
MIKDYIESLLSPVMNERLIQQLQKIDNFSDEEIDMLQSKLIDKFIGKGDHFLHLGQVSRHVAFIDTGLMMHYSLHDGIEIPCNFSLEGDWMGSLKSFTTGSPTDVAIKALEDTWIREISGDHLQQLFLSSPAGYCLKITWFSSCFLILRSIMQISPCSTQRLAITNSCGKNQN